MPYGTIKVDTITFTDGGVDKSVAISGLAQNPTFTGDVTVTGTVSGAIVRATTVSGVTVSGTTINAASGVFTTQISGAVLVVPSGTAAAPSIKVGNGTSVPPGVYSPGSNQIAISTNGTGRLFVDATGNVGIGTSSPSRLVTIYDSSTLTYFQLAHSGASGVNRGLEFILNVTDAAILNRENGPMYFATNNLERLRITSDGNVGIGTSSPSNTAGFVQQVQLAGSLPCFTIEQSNGSYTLRKYSLGVDSVGGLGFWDNTASAYRFYVNTSGQVGIGTTAPTNRLTIRASSDDGIALTRPSDPATTHLLISTTEGGGDAYSVKYETSNNNQIFSTSTASGTGGNIIFRTSTASPSVERVRIDSSGRLLVGATSTSSSALLQVQGNSSSSTGEAIVQLRVGKTNANILSGNSLGSIQFSNTESTVSATIEAVADANWNTTNDYPSRLVFSTTADGASSPTERMRIANNGVVTVKNGAVAEIGTLTDAATITPDFAANCNFTVTLGGNRTIANPTSVTAGQSGSIFIVQDATGSRIASWGANWDWSSGAAPTLSTAANAVDRIDYVVRSATSIHAVWTGSYS